MRGGSKINSVDLQTGNCVYFVKSQVVRFPYYRHDDVKSGRTHQELTQTQLVKCQPVPPLLCPSSIHPSLSVSLYLRLCPSLPPLIPLSRDQAKIMDHTEGVIYRPGFPRELLAPPGIYALRQNPHARLLTVYEELSMHAHLKFKNRQQMSTQCV